MFSITPLGSCRIATPLRIARADYGFSVNQDRIYGFSHSSAEAVQLMRFLKGEHEIDPEIAPVVTRRQTSTLAAVHEPSDLYVIEISSAKILTIGTTCIQLNYLGREYSQFFSNSARVRGFWKVVSQDNQAAIDAFLQEIWSANRQQRAEADLLRRIRRRDATEADLRRDIAVLMQNLPATLFVTHVNAVTETGLPIASRARFIAAVEAAVRAEGGIVYNPTAAMLRMGQHLAIEDQSNSLAHFTEGFSRVVFDDWFSMVIARRMDAVALSDGGARLSSIMVPHVEARLELGHAASLVNKLEALASIRSADPAIERLLGLTYSQLGRSEDALERLHLATRSAQQDDLVRILTQRAELATDLGRHDQAEQDILELISLGVVPGCDLLMRAADAALGAQRHEAALRLYALALERHFDLTAAERIVTLVGAQGRGALGAMVPGDCIRITAQRSLALAWRLAWVLGNERARADLAVQAEQLDESDIAEFVRAVDATEGRDRAAEMMARWRANQSGELAQFNGLHSLVEDWIAAIDPADDPRTQLQGLTAVLSVAPLHVEGRIRLRDLRASLLQAMRTAYANKDLEGLEALGPAVSELPAPIDEYGLLRLRLVYAREDHPRVVALAKELVALAPDQGPVWLMMMRSADKANDLLALDEATEQVLRLFDGEADRIGDEATKRRARLPSRAFLAARTEADPIRTIQLLGIARRKPELAEAVEKRLRRANAVLAADLAAHETTDPEGFAAIAQLVLGLLPENARVRLSVARFLMRRRAYAEALPHWKWLVQSDRTNLVFAQNRDRCVAQLFGSGTTMSA